MTKEASNLLTRIFEILKENDNFNRTDLENQFPNDKEEIENLLKSLTRKEVLKQEKISSIIYKLTSEARIYLIVGSPEYNLFSYLLKPENFQNEAFSNEDINSLNPNEVFCFEKNFSIEKNIKNAQLPENEQFLNEEQINEYKKIASIKTAFSNALSLKYIILNKNENKEKKFILNKNKNEDETKKLLFEFFQHEKNIKNKNIKNNLINDLNIKKFLKRKFITKTSEKTFYFSPAKNFSHISTLSSEISNLDISLMKLPNKELENLNINELNLSALGKPNPNAGSLHPLLRLKSEFRKIFLEMGFKEMETDSFIEMGFWNFDALFIPQQHPARDSQDTFYLDDYSIPSSSSINKINYNNENKETITKISYDNKNEETLTKINYENKKEYLKYKNNIGEIKPLEEEIEAVKRVHEYSYGTKFSKKETNRFILRTHTTAITAKMLRQFSNRLNKLKNENSEIEDGIKYFSIDKVFRNESIDATHLAEFQQIEGFLAGRNITLDNLIALLKHFFLRIGIKELKFKIAFNPYTEPSMEVFGWSEKMGKFIEIGNSGVFRREVLDPAGIPHDVDVIAWGLSLERPAMLMYGIKDIRELCGEESDMRLGRDSEWLLF